MAASRYEHTVGATPDPFIFQSNALNQVHKIYKGAPAADRVARAQRFDADGNLIERYAAADMNCDGVLDAFDNPAFIMALSNALVHESGSKMSHLRSLAFGGASQTVIERVNRRRAPLADKQAKRRLDFVARIHSEVSLGCSR